MPLNSDALPADGVRTERHGPVWLVRWHRPEARNAIDGPTASALRQAFEAFEADDTLSVAVLHGDGGTFCSGADLKAVADPARSLELTPDGRPPGPLGPTRMDFTKPVIAAVEGHAVAGGLELALMADLRVAAEGAVFGVFCRRWGVPLVDGGTVRLPRVIGLGRALDLILTGRPVDAREALALGLANRVVPDGQALAEALALAQTLAGFPQQCLRADRASAYAGWALPMEAALREEGARGAPVVAQEGLAGAARFAAGAGRGGRPA
ncbi:MAG: crotonase/enoyl-CoA hydratase family protein [Rubrivivax sp.]|jgi:enoyl-CoA hydratase